VNSVGYLDKITGPKISQNPHRCFSFQLYFFADPTCISAFPTGVACLNSYESNTPQIGLMSSILISKDSYHQRHRGGGSKTSVKAKNLKPNPVQNHQLVSLG
jgi:hypothetical protein